MKIVINKSFGGFALSNLALKKYNELTSSKIDFSHTLVRNDPILVQIVEELGSNANGQFAELKIVEIPDDVQWSVEEYDGKEWISEVHRTWS